MLNKKRISFVLKIIFIVFALAIILKYAELDKIAVLLSDIKVPVFACVVVICLFDQIFMGLKWNILLKTFNINVPARVPVFIYLKSKVLNMFTPSIIGIDIYKTYCMKKIGAPTAQVISSIFIERFIGFISSLAIIVLLLYFSLGKLNVPHLNIFAAGGIFAFFLIILSLFFLIKYSIKLRNKSFLPFLPNTIAVKLDEVILHLSTLRNDDKGIWYYFIFSILEKVSYGSVIYFSAKAISIPNVEFMHFISSAPLLSLLERLPISISSIGVREGLFVVLFKPYFLEVTIPLTISLVLRCSEIVLVFFCMILWFVNPEGKLFEKHLKNMKEEVASLNTMNLK